MEKNYSFTMSAILFTTSLCLLLVFMSAIFFLVCRGIYNRYFHPLSIFPGPFWGSVTDFHLANIISTVPTYACEMHKKYGSIVRLTPNLLSFSDPKLLPIVYHRYADKTPFYSSWLFGSSTAMFQTLSHESHAVKRRIISPCCSMKLLREYEGRIDERISELFVMFREGSSHPESKLEFSEHIRWFLNDVFTAVLHGKPVGCLAQRGDANGFMRTLKGIYTMSGMVAVLPWLMMPLVTNTFLRKHVLKYTQAFKSIQKLESLHDEMTAERSRTPEIKQTRCFFDSLAAFKSHPEFRVRDEDIRAEAIVFASAALEGVAAFINPFVQNIIQHPLVYSRLRAEIDLADAQGLLSTPIVKFDETSKLTYFMACVYETLRLDAPAQTILPRYISKGGIYVDGRWIPEGTEMAATPYVIHRDRKVFGADAEVFRPERWLEDSSRSEQMHRLGMWFGYGDRECPGKNFAHLEFQKLLVQLLREFDVRSATPDRPFTQERWAVAVYWDHWLHFEARKGTVSAPEQAIAEHEYAL